MAVRRETEYLKPIDKAFFREVSELPDRSEGERRGGLVKEKPMGLPIKVLSKKVKSLLRYNGSVAFFSTY